MKLAFIIFFTGLLCLFSCNKNKKNEIDPNPMESTTDSVVSPLPTRTWVFDSLNIEKKIYIDNDSTKDGMAINLFFKYPTSAPDSVNLSDIQNIFEKIFTAKNNLNLSPKEAFTYKVKEYESEALAYAAEWESENNEYISFSNFEQYRSTLGDLISKNVMTIITIEYSYLGGAHGATNITYNNINLLNNKIIKEEDFFEVGYEPKVAKLIQEQVTKRNESENEVNHIALLVEINEIKPNKNFFFAKEGMVYTYNQYEIAPYVQGQVEITLPYKSIQHLVSKEYQPLMKSLAQSKRINEIFPKI